MGIGSRFIECRAGGGAMARARLQEQYDRPVLDDEFIGTYMRDAISRGGYRKALDYYGGARAKRTMMQEHRLRARGWLLGRLHPDTGMAEWVRDARTCSVYDYMTGVASSAQLEAEKRITASLGLEVSRILKTEPVDATPPEPRSVPHWMWTTMLALDSVGPVHSRAVLSAAAAVVDAEAGRKMYGRVRCDPAAYDPLGGRMRRAPRGHQRWIIGDVDPEMLPLNEPHYYYDLTDEGKEALEYVKRDRAPWARAAVRAAAGLSGKSVPDILEEACGLVRFSRPMDSVKGDLDVLIRAWDSRKGGGHQAPINPKDAVLAGLDPTSECKDDIELARFDHVFFITGTIRTVHEIVCDAKLSSKRDGQVLRILIGKMQDQLRRLGRKISDAPRETSRTRADESGVLYAKMRQKWRLYVGELPASISDLYYCLAEYCKCRGLADDPIDRPLSEILTEREKAALAEILSADPPGCEPVVVPNVARPTRTRRLSNGRNLH